MHLKLLICLQHNAVCNLNRKGRRIPSLAHKVAKPNYNIFLKSTNYWRYLLFGPPLINNVGTRSRSPKKTYVHRKNYGYR